MVYCTSVGRQSRRLFSFQYVHYADAEPNSQSRIQCDGHVTRLIGCAGQAERHCQGIPRLHIGLRWKRSCSFVKNDQRAPSCFLMFFSHLPLHLLLPAHSYCFIFVLHGRPFQFLFLYHFAPEKHNRVVAALFSSFCPRSALPCVDSITPSFGFPPAIRCCRP